jgi:endonuclease VIII-like 1
MPEISEVRIMSDYINESCQGRIFNNVRKSKVSKVKTSLKPGLDYFSISAVSRGKELKLTLTDKSGKEKNLICTMGMSGNWVFYDSSIEYKHIHLMFDTIDGYTLGLVDVRRFAKWKWGDWNLDRGPDPVKEFDKFKENIYENINKRIFNKPICELLLDQKYFNGIGNYLRAEILYKTGQDPFMPAKQALKSNKKILKYCKSLSLEAYQLGGGQLQSWENPYKTDAKSFSQWINCYANPKMNKIVDKTGRALWYDPKWKNNESDK